MKNKKHLTLLGLALGFMACQSPAQLAKKAEKIDEYLNQR